MSHTTYNILKQQAKHLKFNMLIGKRNFNDSKSILIYNKGFSRMCSGQKNLSQVNEDAFNETNPDHFLS